MADAFERDKGTGMTAREQSIVEFLQENKWGKAQRAPLSNDASFRRYERLTRGEKTAMLMDAPPSKEDIKPFINIANYLRRRGLSAPEIYAVDEVNGLILLEDFGNDSFTNVLAGNSPLSSQYNELDLYYAAVDTLIHLDRSTLPRSMPDYDGKLLLHECELLTDWYLPHVDMTGSASEARQEYVTLWKNLCSFAKISDDVVVLRDYHADNLMWLPERAGVQQVGLLDFQDAVIGSPVYDLVSLLEDARRDVSPDTVAAVIERYLSIRKSVNRDDFLAAYAILAAQRNCKIIGIFARLAIRDNKPKYLNYLPRVWNHLEYDLQHPVLAPLKEWFDRVIPQEKRTPETFVLKRKEFEIA